MRQAFVEGESYTTFQQQRGKHENIGKPYEKT